MSNGVPPFHQSPWNLENLKGAIVLGGQAIKSLELINGAAAVGILTFYGNVADKPAGGSIDLYWLRLGLIAFGLGVFVSIVTAIFGYLSQLIAATLPPPSSEMCWRIAALCTGIGSAAMFLAGVVCVAIAF